MRILLPCAATLTLPCAPLALAAAPLADKLPMVDTSGYFLQLVSGLGLVLLSIAALAWLLKRINRLPNRDLKNLELVASLSVGQRERVVIVRAGSSELVLGIAPGHITKLGELSRPAATTANPETIAPETTPADDDQQPTAFSALIAKVRKDTAA
ncbi:flagellar biosynthetic protein FliO [Gammaproteobacteria bacterium 53_120_T64]|mgnify:CR=1 FL=1|nr:flagellar biosynthetic protein FliO [Gammaproteobacteria bacterium 53_120_T64]